MKKVLVAGGTADVGAGIVSALLDAGHIVFVPSRSEERLQKLRKRFPDAGDRLVTKVVDLTNWTEVQSFKNEIVKSHKKINAVINAIHGYWSGQRIMEMEIDVWNRLISGNLTTHIHLVKSFVPIMEVDGSSFLIHLNRESLIKAIPLAAPMNVIAVAHKIISEALCIELLDENVKVVEVLLGTIATKDKIAKKVATPFQYTPEELGEIMNYYVSGNRPRTTVVKLITKNKEAKFKQTIIKTKSLNY